MTSVPPLATFIVCPEDTVTGPTILAFSVAAIESPPVNVCTFLYAPLILVSLAAVTVASVGAPTSKVSPKIIPENVAPLAGAAVNAIVPLDDPAVNAVPGTCYTPLMCISN